MSYANSSNHNPNVNTQKKPLSVLLILIVSTSFYCLLTYTYVEAVSFMFASERLTENYSFTKFTNGLAALLALLLLMPRHGLGAYFFSLMIFLAYIPSLVFYAGGPGTTDFFLIKTLACAIVIVTMKVSNFKVPYLFKISLDTMILFFVSIAIFYFIVLISFSGLTYFNLNFNLVYEIRADASSALPAIFGYITPVIGKVAVPVITVLALMRRSYLIALAAILMGVGLFGFTTHKSPIFYGAISAGIFLVYKSNNRIISFMGFGLIIIVFAGLQDLLMAIENGNLISEQRNGWIGSLFVRRTLMVPAQLDAIWIEFFRDNAKFYWSDSRFSFGLIESPYNVGGPKLIGREMFNAPDLGANTGWVGSGFAQAGLIGVIFYSVALGLFFSFLNKAADKIGKPFVAAVTFPIVITVLLSSDFVTSIVTHGLFAMLLCIMLIYHSPTRMSSSKHA